MDRYTDNFNEHSDSLRKARGQDDFDNLQHTLSGVETGQQARHGLDRDTGGSVSGGGKRKTISELVQETLDWLLLNDPHYAFLHSAAMDNLVRAETITQTALEAALMRLETAHTTHEDILSRAARLADGTRVFRDDNGVVWTEHHTRVDETIAARIQWRSDNPAYNIYLESGKQIEGANNTVNGLRGIETDLGDIRGELSDQNAASTTRIEALNEQIQELQDRVKKVLPEQHDNKIGSDVENVVQNQPDVSAIPVIKVGN